MKTILFIFMAITAVAFMNCSPNANFQNDDDRFKSLMDGETVEVVDQQTFDEFSQEDTGINGDGSSEDDSGADGMNNSNGDRPGGHGHTAGDDDADRPGMGGERRNRGVAGDGERSCRDRLMDQENRGRRGDMLTTPDEMTGDGDMNEAIRCGKRGHKVLVCHHPNGEYAKRKTLCVGAPALQAFIGRMKASSVNYAGPCKDQDGNIADGDRSDRNNGDNDKSEEKED